MEKEENTALIEQMVKDAESVGEPGEIQKVIHEGDEDMPAPMIMSELTSAGHTYIYNTRTGDRSIINLNMLRTKLKLTRADGTAVFTTVKPLMTPQRGSYKCLLHPSDPNRKHYDELGLAACQKDSLNSPYQVRRHMMKKHKMEWEAIEQERQDLEKKEDREFQRKLMDRAVGETPPLYVSKKDKEKQGVK